MENNQLSVLLGYWETKQWDKAWQEFERLSEEGPPSARLLLIGSYAALGRDDHFRARHLAEKALSQWGPSDPARLLGQIRYHLGVVVRQIGDTHIALEQFELFLSELSSKYPELSMAEGPAYFYLALTRRERKDYEGAVDAYRKGIHCFRRDELTTALCTAHQNLAWTLTMMGRTQEAQDSLSEASPLVRTNEHEIHQALGEAYLAASLGHHSQAKEICESIFHRANRGEPVSVLEKGQAAWIAGLVALDQENTEGAAALADVALSMATEAKDSVLMNDASGLKRSIYIRRQAGA